MTLRPVWLAGAFVGALAIHAAIFLQFDAREERGAAPDGDEGILVALGTPAQTGAGGEDEIDQSAEVESSPDAIPPQEIVPEAETRETPAPETPGEELAESQAEATRPEATSVEIPLDAVSEEAEAEQPAAAPDPVNEEPETEPVATAVSDTVRDDTLEPDQPDPPQNVESVPENIDPPVETRLAAIPLPEFRPEPPAHDETSDRAPREAATQNPRSTEPRRSSGAVATGNAQSENRQARTGGGNNAERADYLTRLHSQLVRSKRYPRSARSDGIEGVVQIGLTINREGRVTVFRITSGSGFDVLDEEVRNMVARVQPLPRMPASMEQSQITINMAIRFKLE